jgi:hypothetical protein
MRSENPDRVTPIVVTRGTILAVVGLLAAWGIDVQVSEDQAGALADALTAAVPLIFGLAGALWGARGARARVTPVLPGDTPRDRQGRELRPVDHGPAGGYPNRPFSNHGADDDVFG